jgi:ubiquinone/menaquinone biosynthesis C-methylase UbiE
MNIRRLLQTFLRRYAATEAKAVAPFIVGSRVLDLGAGESYVGATLFSLYGMWVCSADVGAFRRMPGSYVTYDGIRLPFVDDAFDTTLTLLTLHHCENPERVLDEAVRVTRGRLIVIESVYRNRRERFWLNLLDHRLNRHRHHGDPGGA